MSLKSGKDSKKHKWREMVAQPTRSFVNEWEDLKLIKKLVVRLASKRIK